MNLIRITHWKNLKELSFAAWLVAVPTAFVILVGLIFFGIFISDITEVFAEDNPFGFAAFIIFVFPFAVISALNILLLKGVSNKVTPSLVLASFIMPAEWMIGIVLGGDALSSALFNGKQYVTSFPHHQAVLALLFAVVIGINFYGFGKEIRKER